MTLREALKRGGLSYRAVCKALGVSVASIHRLVNQGDWPFRTGADRTYKIVSGLLKDAGVDPAKVDWPEFPTLPNYAGGRRESAAMVKKIAATDTETIELMQLDRDVLQLFGLRRNPFLNDIDDDADVYRFRGYDKVEQAIYDTVEQRGMLAICAESGAGKSTIWDGVEGRLRLRGDVIISKPEITEKDAMTANHIARALCIDLLGKGTRVQRNAEDLGRQLKDALIALRTGDTDTRAVLYVDDAHFCSASVLRQLKTFYEEKAGRFRLLAIVLAGLNPELKQKLAVFAEIGNRIRLVEVPPVPVKDYLEFKLGRIGAAVETLFDKAGFEAFCNRFREPKRQAVGRPLIINATCIRAMVKLYQNGGQMGEKISREIVDDLPGGGARVLR